MIKMETIEIKTYKFEELGKEAKTRAIEDFGQHSREYWDLLPFYSDMCLEKLEDEGFKGDFKIYYRLTYCQGDGMSFEGSFDLLDYLKVNKLLTRFKNVFDDDTRASIKQVGHYYHYNSMELYMPEFKEGKEELGQDLTGIIEEHIESLSKKLEKEGYEQIEYRLSDEAVIEDIKAEDCSFLENGDLFREWKFK
jgi:hypothetical protein